MTFTEKDKSYVIAQELTKNGCEVKIWLLFYAIKKIGSKERYLCYSKTKFVDIANAILEQIEHAEWLNVFSKTKNRARWLVEIEKSDRNRKSPTSQV